MTSMIDFSENKVIKAALNGEQWAFESLLNRYSVHLFKGDARFVTWLFAIGKNLSLNRLKALKSKAYFVDIEMIVIDIESDRSLLNEKVNEDFLLNALNYLGEEDALLLSLYYVKQLTLKEIGLILAIESNNVKVKLFRAREKFKATVFKLQKGKKNI
jgi:RNA polymerase sigma factor (sigma-70 family)